MRERLLRWLRVSERPTPPPGSGTEPEIFRASRRFLYYTVIAWVPKQVAAFFGLLFSLAFFGSLDTDFLEAEGWKKLMGFLEQIEVSVGPAAFDPTELFWFFEALAIVAWTAQFLFTGLFLKLGWELRWYIVGDSSLRIREGLWSLREQTMTIANIQNMKVKQGPLQRVLGIADLEVHTAGGAGSESGEESGESESSFHVGRFRGLEDAHGLRDRIRDLLAEHRGAGLGDHDDAADGAGRGTAAAELREAAAALASEARELSAALATEP